MKCYKVPEINKHIQWLMEMMNTEFPNNYELVIDRDYAEIRSTQTELNFSKKEEVVNYEI